MIAPEIARLKVVGIAGFDPAASRPPGARSVQAELYPDGWHGRTRPCNPPVNGRVL